MSEDKGHVVCKRITDMAGDKGHVMYQRKRGMYHARAYISRE